jgi:hypothetical protein
MKTLKVKSVYKKDEKAYQGKTFLMRDKGAQALELIGEV